MANSVTTNIKYFKQLFRFYFYSSKMCGYHIDMFLMHKQLCAVPQIF